jgi:hypothetical protein
MPFIPARAQIPRHCVDNGCYATGAAHGAGVSENGLGFCIPPVLLIGTYDLKTAVTVSVVQLALFFVGFWFQLARLIDATTLTSIIITNSSLCQPIHLPSGSGRERYHAWREYQHHL